MLFVSCTSAIPKMEHKGFQGQTDLHKSKPSSTNFEWGKTQKARGKTQTVGVAGKGKGKGSVAAKGKGKSTREKSGSPNYPFNPASHSSTSDSTVLLSNLFLWREKIREKCSFTLAGPKDTEVLFHCKLLEVFKICHCALHSMMDVSYDIFKIVPGNLVELPSDLLRSLLPLLLEHIGWPSNFGSFWIHSTYL